MRVWKRRKRVQYDLPDPDPVLLLWLLPLDNVLRTGLSIIACCPAGSLAAVLAKQTGTEATLASQAVAHSTVCMLVTVPAMLLLTGAIFPM